MVFDEQITISYLSFRPGSSKKISLNDLNLKGCEPHAADSAIYAGWYKYRSGIFGPCHGKELHTYTIVLLRGVEWVHCLFLFPLVLEKM